jgi:molybdopterin converting factor subunit 1
MANGKAQGTGVRVKSLFFAIYRDILGTDELEVQLPEGSNVAALIEAVRAHAATDQLPGHVVVAVNQDYASPETVLVDGDEVAFIPPVAGG